MSEIDVKYYNFKFDSCSNSPSLCLELVYVLKLFLVGVNGIDSLRH